jgi:hypothetical protein
MSVQGQTGSKGTTLPNPNYGSGTGVDNSNGTYNAGVQGAQSAQAAAQGSTPLESTATPTTTTASAQVQPYSGAQKGQAGNKGGQPPAPAGGASMTAEQALAQNPRPASYSSYDGQDHTAVPPPAATTPPATAAQPMQGGAIQQYAQSKMQSKGQQPPAQAGMIGGMANATSGNAYADMANRQRGAQATLAGTPWMQKMLTGVDQFGGTNESRAKYETDNNLGARSNAGENTYEHGGTNTDWQSWVKQQTGQADAFTAMKQLADTARNTKGGIGQLANMRRSMEASGIDPGVAARVLELFHNSGGDQEQAARRLGVYDQYVNAGMGLGDKSAEGKAAQIANEKANAAWHAENKANPPKAAERTAESFLSQEDQMRVRYGMQPLNPTAEYTAAKAKG